MKIYNGTIPFEVRNNPYRKIQMPYADRFTRGEIVELENKLFFATLKIVDMSRGRSSATFDGVLLEVECSDSDYQVFLEGVEVSMFMTDMLHMITHCNMYGGKVKGLWSFCKRGSNYGLKFESPV